MIEYHRTHGGQDGTSVFPKARRLTANSERRPAGPESRSATRPDTSTHLHWEILAVWSLALFCFAALLFCLYLISMKCHTDWHF